MAGKVFWRNVIDRSDDLYSRMPVQQLHIGRHAPTDYTQARRRQLLADFGPNLAH